MSYDAILTRLWALSDRMTAVENGLADLKRTVEENHRGGLCAALMSFLKDMMTPHQWAIVVLLVLASAAGIISPKDIVNHMLMQDADGEHK